MPEVRHGRTMEQWINEVDAECVKLADVSVYDLADFPAWDYWSSGYTPADTAIEILEEEGYDVEDEG